MLAPGNTSEDFEGDEGKLVVEEEGDDGDVEEVRVSSVAMVAMMVRREEACEEEGGKEDGGAESRRSSASSSGIVVRRCRLALCMEGKRQGASRHRHVHR